MAVNLTPQYHEAEEAYKRAQTAEERLACLQKMYQLVPKHKASEKLQADLKTKLSLARDEAEKEKKSAKKPGVSYKVPKQGAGQYALLGPPNAGKSRLISSLTAAKAEVAPYPYTTREPVAGMMDWEDVRVQLVDLPPVTADFCEPFVSSLARAADAALLFLDLADDDGPFATQTVIDRLAEVKTMLGTAPEGEIPAGVLYVPTILVATKCTDPGAEDRWSVAAEMFGAFPVLKVDIEAGVGVDALREQLFRFLNKIRVYTKEPGKPADKTAPYTCPVGSNVVDLAGQVHRDLAEKVKSARVWGSAAFDGQTVGRDHVLKDGDIVELHA
ncbi:MAG: TGS domain-containing protein [Gemmataceae bacterium]|nr:TGS domain-containing protein [Gemmataceae bacterium]